MKRIIIISAIMAVAVACGNSGETASGPPASQADADQVTTETTTTSQEGKVYSEEELARALFTLEDMSTGWTVAPPEEEDGETGFCNNRPSLAAATVGASFMESETGSFVSHIVQAFRPGDLEKSEALFREDVVSCAEWEETNEDGTTTTWRLSPLSFPNLGDETFAVRLSANAQGYGTLTMDLIYVRLGNLITGVGYGEPGFTSIDTRQTEEYARLAIEKLESLVASAPMLSPADDPAYAEADTGQPITKKEAATFVKGFMEAFLYGKAATLPSYLSSTCDPEVVNDMVMGASILYILASDSWGGGETEVIVDADKLVIETISNDHAVIARLETGTFTMNVDGQPIPLVELDESPGGAKGLDVVREQGRWVTTMCWGWDD